MLMVGLIRLIRIKWVKGISFVSNKNEVYRQIEKYYANKKITSAVLVGAKITFQNQKYIKKFAKI